MLSELLPLLHRLRLFQNHGEIQSVRESMITIQELRKFLAIVFDSKIRHVAGTAMEAKMLQKVWKSRINKTFQLQNSQIAIGDTTPNCSSEDLKIIVRKTFQDEDKNREQSATGKLPEENHQEDREKEKRHIQALYCDQLGGVSQMRLEEIQKSVNEIQQAMDEIQKQFSITRGEALSRLYSSEWDKEEVKKALRSYYIRDLMTKVQPLQMSDDPDKFRILFKHVNQLDIHERLRRTIKEFLLGKEFKNKEEAINSPPFPLTAEQFTVVMETEEIDELIYGAFGQLTRMRRQQIYTDVFEIKEEFTMPTFQAAAYLYTSNWNKQIAVKKIQVQAQQAEKDKHVSCYIRVGKTPGSPVHVYMNPVTNAQQFRLQLNFPQKTKKVTNGSTDGAKTVIRSGKTKSNPSFTGQTGEVLKKKKITLLDLHWAIQPEAGEDSEEVYIQSNKSNLIDGGTIEQ